jgi:hypothetical protein
MTRTLKLAAIAIAAAVFGFAGATRAATVIQNGSTVDGWIVTEPAGISLVADGVATYNGKSVLLIEKFATFSNMEGLPITFVQANNSATQYIDIVNESVTNLTGQAWTGFQFILPPSTVMGTAPSFVQDPNAVIPGFDNTAGSPFAPPTGAGVAYGGVTFSPSVVSYTGSQPNLTTAAWGFGTDGDLIIANPVTNGNQVFNFKEQPLNAPVIPLPAAAWSSLSGLLGLALVGYGKNLKKIIA